jgi:hypothetical protein
MVVIITAGVYNQSAIESEDRRLLERILASVLE